MRGRGGQRGRGSALGGLGNREWDAKKSATQNGPLMTDHLRDIDIELEILNRRRQMLQQEHELLDQEREYNLKRHYDYEQPMTSYNQPNYNRQGNKRQAVERGPSKRFNPSARVEPWEHNAQSNNPSFMAHIPPLLSSVTRNLLTRPARPPSRKEFRPTKLTAPVQSNFNPTKVTKQKSRTGYLKKTIISHPKDNQSKMNITPKPSYVPPKSSYVPPTSSYAPPKSSYVPPKSSEASSSAPIVGDPNILRHNVPPSPQLNGRLELALGTILKDIKKVDSSNLTQTTALYQSQRTIKQIIRERIHSVMLDKKVGHMQDIVACYRKKYPVETDAELLKLGQDCQVYFIHTLGITPTINSDNVKDFFKAYLTKVLHNKVEKLLSNLKDISPIQDGDDTILKVMDDVIDLQESDIVEDSPRKPVIKNDELSKDEGSEEEKVRKKIEKAKIYTKLMENLIDARLPAILSRHKERFVTMIEADKEYKLAKAEIIGATVKEAVSLVAKRIHSTKIVDATINNTTITKETEHTEENETVSVLEPTVSQNVSPPPLVCVSTPTSKITEHPYYVKLIGRPELPSRASVYAYLEQFKPASIKKHKTIGNLLVIGFNDKESYEKIMEAGEKIIGENTITIRSSDKVNLTPQKVESVNATPQKSDDALNDTTSKESTSLNNADENSHQDTTDNEEGNKNKDSNATDLNDSLNIGQDLEDQITNLLTVVKNEDVNNDNGEIDKHANIDKNENNAKTKPSESDGNLGEEASKTNSEVTQTTETISQNNENLNSNDTKDDHANGIDPENQTNDAQVEVKDVKSNLKDCGRATPTRSSSRLASTPSTIRTRRASRLVQNQ
ncbi:uncharacterized protein LOC111004021 [Pieris rapae]|uniref:uncharacterized protein LOC111004021 n=1 Tax=Pieris rapae TaxID=64459 RepID=UPI001E281A10|nr:uncharacterized protein LOC111004021 [Pieris rapae]